MNKHTSGPWHWGKDYEGLFGANGEEILCYADYEGMWVRDYLKQGKIDARLIASTPDLLENLIGCMEALASHAPDCIEVQCARAAIAKATGEQE